MITEVNESITIKVKGMEESILSTSFNDWLS